MDHSSCSLVGGFYFCARARDYAAPLESTKVGSGTNLSGNATYRASGIESINISASHRNNVEFGKHWSPSALA